MLFAAARMQSQVRLVTPLRRIIRVLQKPLHVQVLPVEWNNNSPPYSMERAFHVSVTNQLSITRPAAIAASFPSSSSSSSSSIPPAKQPSSNTPFFKLIALALGATVLFGIGDYYWQRSSSKERLERRAGIPLDLLQLLREAREENQRGEKEVDKYARRVQKVREARRKGSDAGEGQVSADVAESLRTLLPSSQPQELLREFAPSLLESERVYHSILARINFHSFDLNELVAAVESGTPTPAMRSVGKQVDPEQVRAAKAKIEIMMNNGDPQLNRKILPAVLSLMAYNLQLQGKVIKSALQLTAAPETSSSEQSPSASTDDRNSPRAILRKAAYDLFASSESHYLQSITLYRHHFTADRTPLAVGVLIHLGELYQESDELQKAAQVWIKCKEMLTAAINNLQKEQAGRAQNNDARSWSDAESFSIPSQLPLNYRRLNGEVSERLAELFRNQNDFESSIAWTRDALVEWDLYTSQKKQDAAINPTPLAIPSLGLTQQLPISPAILPYLQAMEPLPHALHLLNGIAADMYAEGRLDSSYITCLQSLEVIRTIVALDERARGCVPEAAKHDVETMISEMQIEQSDASGMAATTEEQVPAAVSDANDHARFVEVSYAKSLNDFIRFHLPQREASMPEAEFEGLQMEIQATYHNLATLLADAGKDSVQVKQLLRSITTSPQSKE